VTRVLIGASSRALRAWLESSLARNATFEVVGSLSIDDALARCEELEPDVVLLESPADESASLAIESSDGSNDAALIILTDDTKKFLTKSALRSGVRAILPREVKPEEIFAAIRACSSGLVVLHRDALDSLLPVDAESQPELDSSDQILTPREIAVLRMIADGLGNKEIASKLKISDHTVKFHISSIFAKLGAANRAEAVTLGIRLGVIMV
jgi:NarL family two-component system response regulator YdfI